MRTGSLVTLGFLAACNGTPTAAPPSPSPTPAPSPAGSPAAPAGAPVWARLSAKGPSARRDYAFAGAADGATAYLFGGRSSGSPLDDFWIYDVAGGAWRKGPGGPAARFGANLVVLGERVWMFGGQGGPTTFFNDVWEFDGSRWRDRSASPAPEERYGSGGTVVGSRLVVSHGFTNSGRFDDTWSWDGSRWRDISPRSGPTPVKRCLNRIGYLGSRERVVLFGGQTDGTPFLGDTWLYDASARRWAEVDGSGPAARNLYASGSTETDFWVFGGLVGDGVTNDTWRFDGSRWRRVQTEGRTPPERGGIEGAMLGTEHMLVFGGTDGSKEFDDLWRLTLA